MGGLSHTVSGDIASFRTPSRVPIESLKFHFLPKQEGSGDPSPTNVRPITGWTGVNGKRAGKNLIKPYRTEATTIRGLTITPTEKGVRVQGTATAEYPIRLSSQDVRFLDPGRKYTFSLYLNGDISGCKDPYLGYNTGETYISIQNLDQTNNYIFTWTVPDRYANAPAPWFDMYIRVREGSTVNFEIGLQMEAGSNATDYEPYSGEQIPITFSTNGKNLADDENSIANAKNMTKVGDRTYTNTIADTKSSVNLYVVQYDKDYKVLKTDTYHGSIGLGRNSKTFDAVKNCSKVLLKHNGSVQDLGVFFPWDGRVGTYTISANFTGIDPSTIGGFVFSDVQIELGDTATSYEPYSSDNTFYGGYIDPVAGEIVAEYAIDESNGRDWTIGSSRAYQWQHVKGVSLNNFSKNSNICTHWINNKHTYYAQEEAVGVNENGALCIGKNFFIDAGLDYGNLTSSQIEEYFEQQENNGTPFRVCYPLLNPIHIPIPAEDLKAFLDHNNFWSDANDVTEVTYAVTESKDILKARKLIIVGSQPHIETASGLVAHFDTDMKAPVKELKVYFKPWQYGYGNPSPENIRSIQGHTKSTIKTSGKNMLNCMRYGIPGEAANISYSVHVNEDDIIDYVTAIGDNDRTNLFRNLTKSSRNGLPLGTFSFNSFSDQANILPIRQDNIPSDYASAARFTAIDGGGIGASRTGWFDWDIKRYDQWNSWVRIQIYPNGGPGTIDTTIYPMMCHPLDRGCSFEAYHGKDYEVEFPALLYGGYIDLIRNKVIATHGIYRTVFGPSNPSGVLGDYERHGYNMNIEFKPAIDLHDNGQGPYSGKKTFCNVAFWEWNYFGDHLHYYIDGHQAYIMLPVGTDPDTEIEFCAELATPIEYDITPQILKTLKGTNNIWSDANGAIDVKYWTH